MVGYLLGSIPVALLVARRHGVDLHRTGDGNPGAWNALEQLGARRAWPAFAGDALKALVGRPDRRWRSAAGGTAYAGGRGAPWSATRSRSARRLRGGKAVMTFVGGVFALVAARRGGSALALCVAVTLARVVRLGRARRRRSPSRVLQLATDPVEHVAGHRRRS